MLCGLSNKNVEWSFLSVYTAEEVLDELMTQNAFSVYEGPNSGDIRSDLLVGKIWDGMGYWLSCHTMVWYGSRPRIPYQSWFGMGFRLGNPVDGFAMGPVVVWYTHGIPVPNGI